MYQKYKGQVNFLWAYAREAHPEERPFQEGFETKDLGWDYRYFETTTMEQRAQRAWWMKHDLEPDAEMPMIIDFINSPLGPDNAIWDAYTGGGFYAGFVIDCDGTIIHQSPWAWHAPGGQWWGLPLDMVTSLESFLDNYLADPPPCYDQGAKSFEPEVPQGQPWILIVDDDGSQPYEGYFKIPLGNLKTHYQVWNVQAEGSPSLTTLQDHHIVVWLTGNTRNDTLTALDQANLAAYLDGGGKLFISGQNIGQDIGDSAFYRDYLHATYVSDDSGLIHLVGSDILSGIEVALTGVDGAGNQSSPSQIGLLDGAAGVFSYGTPPPEAWAGLRWEGDYQVVYFAFGFEGLGTRGAAAFRFEILERLLDWFDPFPCGDANCDGTTNGFDIDEFVVAMGSLQDWIAAGNTCDPLQVLDTNGDGAVNGFDIDGFVEVVGGGQCPRDQ